VTLPSIRAGALAIAAGVTLVSCANALAVPWATYDPALRARIADAVATRACPALQKLLDSAKQTSGEHERATGYRNDDLVAFIEEAQAKAGCP
jgi:hypothetical protein